VTKVLAAPHQGDCKTADPTQLHGMASGEGDQGMMSRSVANGLAWKYLPLVWSAIWRKPTEAVLVWLAVTASFTLFGLMVGLHASYDQVIATARLDRIYVNARFPGASATGVLLPISAREEIAQVNGVSAVAAVYYLWGYYHDPHQRARIRAVDEHMRSAWPELPLTPAQWDQLLATPTGIFVSHSPAARLGVKRGDMLPVTTPPGTRADGAPAWEFHVLGVVPDMPNHEPVILGNFSYVDNSVPPSARGYAQEFRVAVKDGAQAEDVAARIDEALANSSTPTISIPDKVAEVDAVNYGISVASKTWPVAGAGIFMILLLTANGIAQSVRERTSEFAVLKTLGFADSTLVALVFAEAAIPCLAGAGIGTGIAKLMSGLPLNYLPTNLASLPKPTLSLAVLSASLACALLLALASTAIPMRRLRHLTVTDALAGR
jgi:putative ABC transport system permease protein